jgi:hypothetical protein
MQAVRQEYASSTSSKGAGGDKEGLVGDL